MNVLVVILAMAGIIVVRVLAFFYPDWTFFKREPLTRKQKFWLEAIPFMGDTNSL